MGKITFITGGARSGKSYHAELIAKRFSDVAYVATGIDTDTEMKLRIARHKQQRPNEWSTYEAPYDIVGVVRKNTHEVYLIDCITVYITNLILKEKQDWEAEVLTFEEQQQLEGFVDKSIAELIDEMKKNKADFIVVSNEVGLGLVPAYALGRIFRDAAGRANRMLAEAADTAYLSVSGILMPLKQEV
ncbi:MAG: bifunctional adenosylcobinamide kinase/adenosylcobinamide-phosphate guanylyltransferase [Christensenella sp.]